MSERFDNPWFHPVFALTGGRVDQIGEMIAMEKIRAMPKRKPFRQLLRYETRRIGPMGDTI